MIKRKVDWLYRHKLKAHVRRHDGWFFNGIIEDINETESLFVIRDVKIGLKAIFFDEVYKVEEFSYDNDKEEFYGTDNITIYLDGKLNLIDYRFFYNQNIFPFAVS